MPDASQPSAAVSPSPRVLLADDHSLLLEGLANLLDAHGVPVVGMARDGLEAIDLARKLKPDLILMDIRMPRCNGLAATRVIKAEAPDVKIIILTTSDEEEDLFEAIKSGAGGYLLKSMDAEALVECIQHAQRGVPPFSPGLAAKLLGEFARLSEEGARGEKETQGREPAAGEKRLTGRQTEVLQLVAQGFSYKEVGAKLGLSPRTIKYHMAEIMEQLHLSNRAQVLAYAGKIQM